MIQAHNGETSADPAQFDVRGIPCRVKHARILQRWRELPVRAHFVLINDQDPVPLRFQFSAQFPGEFTWEYLRKGPEQYHIRIRRVSGAPGAGIRPAEAPARL
jgi:uncharacterized protein (DUF2249 family)